MSAPHWAEAYIGDAWVLGTHDCRAFVERVWRERFGRRVSLAEVRRERRHWLPVDVPQEGDGVLMLRGDRPHVGIWIDADGGGVLHCQRGAGVVFSSRQALAAAAWNEVRYYRRRS